MTSFRLISIIELEVDTIMKNKTISTNVSEKTTLVNIHTYVHIVNIICVNNIILSVYDV